MIGTTISHYKILEKLGGGGMGVVYKAQDLKLDRQVALKFLPPDLTRDPEAKERFVHEAKAASALDHNNICNIHEIDETPDGQLFIVMGYYEGETLKKKIERGPLKIDEATDIAIQIAQGLEEAHKHQIVHRDIKPANVLITASGVVKIVDFGLAKLAGRTALTQSGSTVGTAAYMSPEQARGEAVDARTDIWSLGVVMYEMVTGQLPFKSEYHEALAYSILNEQPSPVTGLRTGVPMELERIIGKCIEKKAVDRYQHADELLVDLKSLKRRVEAGEVERGIVVAKPLVRRRLAVYGGIAIIVVAAIIGVVYYLLPTRGVLDSIAVLPLENLSADPTQEYFSDGMTDELITELQQIKSLRVISRTSVKQYKGTKKTLPEIARELDVKAIVEGSVLREGDNVRINVQLVQASPEKHLWASAFDRSMKNILMLQSEVARTIAREVRAVLTPGEQAALQRTRIVNTEAYQEYLKGRFFWLKRNKHDLQTAVEHFTKAINLDTTFAPPYSGLADACLMMANYGSMEPSEAYEKARKAAVKSLELDPDFAEAHASLGFLHLVADWRWGDAETRFKKAIELNPNYSNAYNWYAVFLAGVGRHAEALQLIRRSQELDPFSLIINDDVGWVLYLGGRYQEAIEQYHKTLTLDSSFVPAHEELGRVYVQKKMYVDALVELKKAMTLTKSSFSTQLAYCYAVSGNKDEARSMLQKILTAAKKEYVSPYDVAVVFCGLGEKEVAFSWLRKAIMERSSGLLWFKSDPAVNSLRTDRRFVALLTQMGLEE